MSESWVELRSDTFTLPCAAMRASMAAAAVGDDVFNEDPTVHELEALAAQMTGKAAGLFVPSGCMANLIAQMVYVRRGDEVLVGHESHIVLYEVGAGAAIAGVQYQVVPGDGRITSEQVESRIKAGTFHTPGTGLVWVENSHNQAGGRLTGMREMEAIGAVCRKHRVSFHLDGARAFNAAVALGVPLKELAAAVDSLSFCLSKGLGAPVGSVLCGSEAFRTAALRFRKMLGGGMRQAGIIAAAGVYALRHNVDRLAEDHAHARILADRLAAFPGIELDPAAIETNIVIARLPGRDAREWEHRAGERGVRLLALDKERVRFVTHLGVDRKGIERALSVLEGVNRDVS